jgi:hypothetical protein
MGTAVLGYGVSSDPTRQRNAYPTTLKIVAYEKDCRLCTGRTKMTLKSEPSQMLKRIAQHIRKIYPPFKTVRKVLPSGCVLICLIPRSTTPEERDDACDGDWSA